jgi:transposase
MITNNKEKKKQIINEKVLIVAVDIGSIRNTGYWRYSGGPESKVFSFGNTKEGFELFMKMIIVGSRIHHAEKIIVGFESTGIYSEPFVHYLQDKPVELVQVNPFFTKRWKDVNGNNRTKSDMKDPLVIADIIEMRNYLSVIVPKGDSAQLRRLTNARERLLDKKKRAVNQLYNLVYLIFPEFIQVMNGIKTKSSYYLIEHYLLPEDIVELGYEKLVLLLKKISRGKLGFDRAQKLLEAAKQSVGIQEGRQSLMIEIKQLLQEISFYDNFIMDIEKEIELHLKKIPFVNYIISIKGIAEITAAGIIGEVGDFEAIRNQYSLIKLAGLNLCENSSGKRKGRICISKQGRPLLRKLLYFASLNLVKKDRILHDYYNRLVKRGVLKMKALVAVMRKLLRLIFALIRDKTHYQNNYNVRLAA